MAQGYAAAPRRYPCAVSSLKVALLGCGVVGSEVARVLTKDAGELANRVGAPLELVGIACLVWCWHTFHFSERRNLDRFVRTGHLPRDVAA